MHSDSEFEYEGQLSPEAEEMLKRRLERMRQGQNAVEPVNLLSDPEKMYLLVPLTDAENQACLSVAAMVEADDNMAGHTLRDRVQENEILARSIRDPQDITKRLYKDGKELALVLDATDINHLMDHYLEMVAKYSPKATEIPEAEQERLKKFLLDTDWNEFDGTQWYAVRRLLVSIFPRSLTANSPGSGSTKNLTSKNGEADSAPAA